MNAPDHRPAPRLPTGTTEQPWTAERIRSLGTVTSVGTAAAIFGLSRSSAYDLVKRGRFPITVLQFGSRYRVPVAAILHALHLPAGMEQPQPPDPT